MKTFQASSAFINFNNNLIKDNISHAYLFVSPDQLTNSFFVLRLIKILLCKTNNGCGECPACKKIEANSHPDVLKYPKGRIFVVDDANDLNLRVIEKPMLETRKVIVIQNIDEATVQAQNKILKTLEEPPASVIFLLTAKNISKVLPTIISRSRKEHLPPLSSDEIKELFSEPFNIEDIEYLPENVRLVSDVLSYGEGWIGKTLNALTNESFSAKQILAKDIALNLTSSRAIATISSKILTYKDDLNILFELLSKEFNRLLTSCQDPLAQQGICEILNEINNSNLKLGRNVNVNLIVDNLLMKILEIKFDYQI
jgi:DNA polymerase-3 subunit delta'